MYLEKTRISGTLPPEIGQMTNLDIFYGDYTQISGTIPKEVSQMSGLDFLYLAGTRLSGTLPKELSMLELDSLHLGATLLSGSLPTELANTLGYLNLGRTKVTSDASPPHLFSIASCLYRISSVPR